MDLDPEVQMRLKVAAALKGISMRQYCLVAIENELAQDPGIYPAGPSLSEQGLNRLAESREKIFGGRMLPGDSADLIREEREKRTRHLERLSRG